MSIVESSMSIEEFLHHDEENNITQEAAETEIGEIAAVDSCEELELDVQKAVVESLAAEKVERDERIDSLEKENARLSGENDELKQKIAALTEKLSECENELSKVGDLLLKNSETEASNKISLLDRNIEMPDRFVGETREQVLEVIKEARDQAESAGRIRRAQVLEGVLVANESTGELAKKRNALEKFFNENGNILSGTVIAELDRCAIAYKNGEDYLLTSEIIRRTY